MNRLKIGEPCAFSYYIVDIHEEVRIMPTTKGPLHPSVQQFKEFVNHHLKWFMKFEVVIKLGNSFMRNGTTW